MRCESWARATGEKPYFLKPVPRFRHTYWATQLFVPMLEAARSKVEYRRGEDQDCRAENRAVRQASATRFLRGEARVR